MTIRENIFADFEDALIKAESSLEFISVTEDSKFGYRRLEVDITHVEGMDIESGCFSRRERSYLEKTLESITKYSTQFNADGDEESYYCVDYRILDRRGREITPAIRYTYNWFAGAGRRTKHHPALMKRKNSRRDLQISLQERLPCSSGDVRTATVKSTMSTTAMITATSRLTSDSGKMNPIRKRMSLT